MDETIDNCPYAYRCPRIWTALEPTRRDGVRHCRVCGEEVVRVTRRPDWIFHTVRGQRVVRAPDRSPPHEILRRFVLRPDPDRHPRGTLSAILRRLLDAEEDEP